MNSLLNLFSKNDMLLYPEELNMSLNYHTRTHRGHIEVESEAGPARVMMFVSSPAEETRYYKGFGNYVIPNRHLTETPSDLRVNRS